MTDQFKGQLDHLLHIARERIDEIDNGINHCNALADRYRLLQEAIDNVCDCQNAAKSRMMLMLHPDRPVEESERIASGIAEVLEYRRQVA